MSSNDHPESDEGLEDEELTDPVSRLPLELSTLILSYLEAEHLFAVSLVSKAWRRLVNTNSLWKKICLRHNLHDENFPFEFKAPNHHLSSKGWCRWAHIYRLMLRRRRKWEMEDTINLCVSQEANCFGVHGTTLAIANSDSNISIHSNIGHEIIPVQKIEVGSTIRDIHVALDTIVCLVGDWAAILRLESGQFKAEAIFEPDSEHWHDQLTDLQNIDGEPRKTKTLLVTKDYVWFATSALKIYCRLSRTFIRHQVTHIIDVKHNHNWVAILRPDSVDLFRHNGTMEFSISDESFYTGLVISTCAVSFLESPDFDDPVAAYVDLTTRQKTIVDAKMPQKLKVYKLTLFQETIFCLNGRERFELSCHQSSGDINWIVPLLGSKYLRPGKDFFTVICSKFIFLSPAQARLDVFDLYEMNTGDKLYTVSIHSSSYNFRHVSDTGLAIQTGSGRSRGSARGGYVSWVSLV